MHVLGRFFSPSVRIVAIDPPVTVDQQRVIISLELSLTFELTVRADDQLVPGALGRLDIAVGEAAREGERCEEEQSAGAHARE